MGNPEVIAFGTLRSVAHACDVSETTITRLASHSGYSSFKEMQGAFRQHLPEADQAAAVITPVPGGVGPMAIATLMANTVIAAHSKAGKTAEVLMRATAHGLYPVATNNLMSGLKASFDAVVCIFPAARL